MPLPEGLRKTLPHLELSEQKRGGNWLQKLLRGSSLSSSVTLHSLFTLISGVQFGAPGTLENERACVSVGCRTRDRKLFCSPMAGRVHCLQGYWGQAGVGGDTRTWPWRGLLRVIWASPSMTQTWGAALLTVFARCPRTRCQLPGAELGLALLCMWALK